MSMTAEEIVQDIPTPKYRIGQQVFHASKWSTSGQYPCPDCLGSGKWKVTTPAGSEMVSGCQRCGQYSSSDIPSLKFQKWEGSVQPLTIGSVQINTAAGKDHHWQRDPVQYMCRETGIGSGTVYDERKLYLTEDEAKQVADAMAAEANSKAAETPKRLEQERVSHLRIEDANLDMFKNGLWQSWYRYRDLREKLEEWRKDENAKIEDINWDLDWEFDYEKRHSDARQTFEKIIIAAANSSDETLKKLVTDLPFKPMVFEPAQDDAL